MSESPGKRKLHVGFIIASWVLWGLLLMSGLTYMVLMRTMEVPPREEPVQQILVHTLIGVSVVLVLLSVGARFGGWAIVRSNPSDVFRAVGWLVLTLISWALTESVMVYGLTLRIMGAAPLVSTGLWVTGMVFLIALAPLSWSYRPRPRKDIAAVFD